MALGLRLQRADSLFIDIQKIVGEAVALGHRELADGDTATGGQVNLVAILNDPASLAQLPVDRLSRRLFRCYIFSRQMLPHRHAFYSIIYSDI